MKTLNLRDAPSPQEDLQTAIKAAVRDLLRDPDFQAELAASIRAALPSNPPHISEPHTAPATLEQGCQCALCAPKRRVG